MKKWLKILLVVVGGIILLFVIDLIFIFTINRPLLAIKEDNGDSVNLIYRGILYDTYNCHEYSSPQIKIKGAKYTCDVLELDMGTVVSIKDKTKEIEDFACAEALEQFYEDETHTYYWNCIKNDYMVVQYDSGNEEPISEALKCATITISDLDKFNIEYIKMEKENEAADIKLNVIELQNCNLKLNEYYKNNDRVIYTTCLDEVYVIRKNSDAVMTLKYYLEKAYQTVNDSINKLVSDMEVISMLKDGGTKIYKKDNYTIILCNTIDGNKDVYIGNKDFKYEQGYCK